MSHIIDLIIIVLKLSRVFSLSIVQVGKMGIIQTQTFQQVFVYVCKFENFYIGKIQEENK